MQIIKPSNIPTTGGIYKFTFDSGGFYIGSSQSISKRIWSHERAILTNSKRGLNRYVKKAVSISTAVTFEVLEIISDDIVRKKREEKYLTEHIKDKNCLNYLDQVIPLPLHLRKPKQISASISPELMEAIKEVQKKEKIESFSQMVETILSRDGQVSKFIKPKK